MSQLHSVNLNFTVTSFISSTSELVVMVRISITDEGIVIYHFNTLHRIIQQKFIDLHVSCAHFFSCLKMLNALNFANVILIDECIQSRIISCLQISDNFELTRLRNSAISMKFCLQFFNENNVTSLSKGSQTRNMILHGIFTFTVISFNQNTIVPGFNCFELQAC